MHITLLYSSFPRLSDCYSSMQFRSRWPPQTEGFDQITRYLQTDAPGQDVKESSSRNAHVMDYLASSCSFEKFLS